MTDERRAQIIRLLQTLNEGLPEPTRRDHSTAGFVNEPRPRTCPDCLANGRVMFGCETCGGAGTVTPARLSTIAAPDVLPDDTSTRDPYADSETVQPYGVGDTMKFGHVPARDAAIDRMRAQTREPFKSLEDELADANRNPYPWERERAALRRRYSIGPLLAALDALRDREPDLASVVTAVYVNGYIEASPPLEQACQLALAFIDDRMPARIQAPSVPGEPEHPALSRVKDRRAA